MKETIESEVYIMHDPMPNRPYRQPMTEEDQNDLRKILQAGPPLSPERGMELLEEIRRSHEEWDE